MTGMTGICVTYNTYDLFKRAYESVRKFYPDIPMIIVDGSDEGNACSEYVDSLESDLNMVYSFDSNIGHGLGMDFALKHCNDDVALVFDSDIMMIKDPIPGMRKLLTPDVYGVGWVYDLARDGYDFGTYDWHREKIPYLHPFFMLLNVDQYKKYHRFVHHGSPCYKAMIDLKDKGGRIINFPGLGHTRGAGANWKAIKPKYLIHDFGGTRIQNKKDGKDEIREGWEI